MRRIFFTYHTGYVGSDGHDCQEYPDDVTEEQLNEDAWQGALSNADIYGYYPYPDDFDPDVDDEEDFSEGIEGSWEDYVPEKHDMLRPGGGVWF